MLGWWRLVGIIAACGTSLYIANSSLAVIAALSRQLFVYGLLREAECKRQRLMLRLINYILVIATD